MTGFLSPPAQAAYRHRESRDGFEVAFPAAVGDGFRVAGHAAGVLDGELWAVEYEIDLDERWLTRGARVRGRSRAGTRVAVVEADGSGGWRVDGRERPELAGCLDVDLEASGLTNAFPVRRLGLGVGESADAPAAWVRALDLGVERLEQRYARLPDADGRQRYAYEAPAFAFSSQIEYGEDGFPAVYPGIAVRLV